MIATSKGIAVAEESFVVDKTRQFTFGIADMKKGVQVVGLTALY